MNPIAENPLQQFLRFRRKLIRGDYGRWKTFFFHVLIPILLLQFAVLPNLEHILFVLMSTWILYIYIAHGVIGAWRAEGADNPKDPEVLILKAVLLYIGVLGVLKFLVLFFITVEFFEALLF